MVPGADLDVRDEVMAQIYDPGDPAAKRSLVYRIEMSDDGDTCGWLLYERRTIRNWRQVGTLTFDQATVSYNGDFVLAFNHAPWRVDRNDPSTVRRRPRRGLDGHAPSRTESTPKGGRT